MRNEDNESEINDQHLDNSLDEIIIMSLTKQIFKFKFQNSHPDPNVFTSV